MRSEVQDGAVRGRQITEILRTLQDVDGEEFDVLERSSLMYTIIYQGLSSECWFLIGSPLIRATLIEQPIRMKLDSEK